MSCCPFAGPLAWCRIRSFTCTQAGFRASVPANVYPWVRLLDCGDACGRVHLLTPTVRLEGKAKSEHGHVERGGGS